MTRLVVGTHRIAIAGMLPEITAHRHATPAVVVGVDAPLTVVATGRRHVSRAAILAPNFVHSLEVTGRLAVFLFPPQAAASLPPVRDTRSPSGWLELGRGAVDGELRSFDAIDAAFAAERVATSPLDDRLVGALDAMSRTCDENLPVAEIAAGVGLSASRLIALARDQLGAPLRTYRRWLRAFEVARGYAAGASLTAAAHAAGFASSAHLSAAARSHFGIRPSHVLNPRSRGGIVLAPDAPWP